MQENQFEGIPALDDVEGLENYLNNENLAQLGISNEQPQMLQPNENANPQPNVDNSNDNNVTYTADQIAQIIAENKAYRQQLEQYQQPQPQPTRQVNPQNRTYSQSQAELIKRAIDRGIPLEKIMQSLNANNPQNQLMQKINNLEAYLAQRDYQEAQNQFVSKMQNFGTKFGLSESDLVTFANTALSKGINLINTPDVETVFRAIYPDQYAIRMQRINSTPSAIYGGGNVGPTPQENSKQVDAYVESFLKSRMPNQYNKR